MAAQNIEMIRVAYDVAYAQRSLAGVRDRFAEDFVWHSRPSGRSAPRRKEPRRGRRDSFDGVNLRRLTESL